MEEVGKAATRLESSFESRRATIRNLAVLRSIEDQAHEVSLALFLSSHSSHVCLCAFVSFSLDRKRKHDSKLRDTTTASFLAVFVP